MPTLQEQMKSKLESCGLPYKNVECYGSQIVVTVWCKKSAERWIKLLSKFSKIRGTTESYDYAKKNKGTCLKPTRVRVYRVFSVIV